MNPLEVRDMVLDAIRRNLEGRVPDVALKLKEQLSIFRNSESLVYCETCGLIFFSGKAKVVAEETRYVEWKMLSFRHCWDREDHKVVISMPYFGLSILPLGSLVRYFDPEDNTKINYYEKVADKKKHYKEIGHIRAFKSFDQNWLDSPNSKCVCSVCGSSYASPRDACFCHMDQKPFLSFSDINSLTI
jgi:ribosomal protein S27E